MFEHDPSVPSPPSPEQLQQWARQLLAGAQQRINKRWGENLIHMAALLEHPNDVQQWGFIAKEDIQSVRLCPGTQSARFAVEQVKWMHQMLCLVRQGAQWATMEAVPWKVLANVYDAKSQGNQVLHALVSVPAVLWFATGHEGQYTSVVRTLCQKLPAAMHEKNAYEHDPLDLAVDKVNPLALAVLIEQLGSSPLARLHPDGPWSLLTRASLNALGHTSGWTRQSADDEHLDVLHAFAALRDANTYPSHYPKFASKVLKLWSDKLDQCVVQWINTDKNCMQLAVPQEPVLDTRMEWLQALQEVHTNAPALTQVSTWLQAYANAWGEKAALRCVPHKCIKKTTVASGLGIFANNLCPEVYSALSIEPMGKKVGAVRKKGTTSALDAYDLYEPMIDDEGASYLESSAMDGVLGALREVEQKVCVRWDQALPMLNVSDQVRRELFALTARWGEKIKLDQTIGVPKKAPIKKPSGRL